MNIKGMNKAKILTALYNNSKPIGIGHLQFSPEDMKEDDARKLIDSGETSFDYIRGRVMKIDLSSDELDTRLYNRDLGEGACERVINSIDV